jgi:hypothetical protein
MATAWRQRAERRLPLVATAMPRHPTRDAVDAIPISGESSCRMEAHAAGDNAMKQWTQTGQWLLGQRPVGEARKIWRDQRCGTLGQWFAYTGIGELSTSDRSAVIRVDNLHNGADPGNLRYGHARMA